jgi:hypothetical protein
MPVPVTVLFKAWVCGRSPAEIVGSNPAAGMDVRLLWVLLGGGFCDELITRPTILPTVVRRCVWYRNLENEESLARVGLQRHRREIYMYVCVYICGFFGYIYNRLSESKTFKVRVENKIQVAVSCSCEGVKWMK